MNITKIKLPSNGLLEKVPAEITVRGMKGQELSMIYSNFNDESVDEVIKAVIVDEDINLTDLTDQDKAAILHSTRTQTFGNITTQAVPCPFCGQIHEYDINYDQFETKFLEEEYITNNNITIGDNTYERRVPTSGTYQQLRAFRDKYNINQHDEYILKQMAFIKKLNNKVPGDLQLLNHLKDLPGKELHELSRELELDFGLKTIYKVDCNNCKKTIPGVLGITPNLFR